MSVQTEISFLFEPLSHHILSLYNVFIGTVMYNQLFSHSKSEMESSVKHKLKLNRETALQTSETQTSKYKRRAISWIDYHGLTDALTFHHTCEHSHQPQLYAKCKVSASLSIFQIILGQMFLYLEKLDDSGEYWCIELLSAHS